MTDSFDPFAPNDADRSNREWVPMDLEFETVRHFREEMAPYLGDRGFFARSEQPFPVNTPVHFRFLLPEGFVLAEGRAVVVWTIEPETNPDLIPGMALRFVQVDDQSRSVIVELVDFHIATGGDQFDIGPTGARDDEIPTDALESTLDEPSENQAGSEETDPSASARKTSRHSDVSDEVLPDWLLEASGRGAAAREKSQREPPAVDPASDVDTDGAPGGVEVPAPDPVPQRAGAFSESADLEVELVLDDESAEPSPHQLSREDAGASTPLPARESKQPRDMRVGLAVAAALSVVAVAILLWSFWLRPDQPTSATKQEAPEAATPAPAGPGVELVEGDTPSGSDVSEKALVSEEGPVAPVVSSDPRLVEPSETTAAPATRIEDVMAAARPGQTTVVIRGNGSFTDEAVDVKRLPDPPRIWLRIRHIETFYRPNELTVGSPEVQRVRIGHHPEERPSSLYVVLDVADESVIVTNRSVEGDTISVSVARQ